MKDTWRAAVETKATAHTVSLHTITSICTQITPLYTCKLHAVHTLVLPITLCGEQVHSQVTLVVIQCQVISLLLLQNESIVVAVAG